MVLILIVFTILTGCLCLNMAKIGKGFAPFEFAAIGFVIGSSLLSLYSFVLVLVGLGMSIYTLCFFFIVVASTAFYFKALKSPVGFLESCKDSIATTFHLPVI